jgi:4-amino-4-deoxy-L-arabinose transferase-like glycosyltransferase
MKKITNIFNPRVNERYHWKGISRMEFPLMQWLFAQVYRIFGNHIIISRILSFILGLITLWGAYGLFYQLFKHRLSAVLTAWALCFSPLFYYYTMNPMPDNFALCCSVWAAAFFFKYMRTKKFLTLLAGMLCLSLASLTKLPFILYFSIITSYFILLAIQKKLTTKLMMQLLLSLSLLIPAIAWYAWVIPDWNNGVTSGLLGVNKLSFELFLTYVSYHFYSTFPELLLNYLSLPFFLWALVLIIQKRLYTKPLFFILMAWGISILLYFVFEINMITKVHDYYLMPFLPLIFIFVAYALKDLLTTKKAYKQVASLVLLLLLPFTAYLRSNNRWNPEQPGFNKDLLEYKTELSSAVADSCLVVVGNDNSPSIWLYYLHKKGWVFNHNELDAEELYEIRKQGGRYLYSDSRVIDTDSLIPRTNSGIGGRAGKHQGF